MTPGDARDRALRALIYTIAVALGILGGYQLGAVVL